jgi:hypothetical protein
MQLQGMHIRQREMGSLADGDRQKTKKVSEGRDGRVKIFERL